MLYWIILWLPVPSKKDIWLHINTENVLLEVIFLSCWSTVFDAVKDVYMLVWSQLSKISTAHVNHGRVLYRVSSFSQPDSLIPFTFNAYFTTNYIASVWEVILNIYLNVDPGNKGLSNKLLFTCSHTILMKNLNGKQNLRPGKDICSCLVKFYCTTDTVYAEYTWIISCISLVSLCLLCNDSCWDSAIANRHNIDHNACGKMVISSFTQLFFSSIPHTN